MKAVPQKLQGKRQTLPRQGQATRPGSQNEGQVRQSIIENNPPGRQQAPEQIIQILNQIKPNIERAAIAAGIPPGYGRVPVMHPEEPDEPAVRIHCRNRSNVLLKRS